MKIGIISDIHANKVALDAVLKDMKEVDKLICCGDIVGYGPRPKQCVEKVREICDLCVQGNHDRDIANPERYHKNTGVYDGLKHAKNRLDTDQFNWITSLNPTDTFDEYKIAHSHPVNIDQYVYPREFKSMMQYMQDNKGLFLGHTHYQHAEVQNEKLILNPGSVGQPRDGDKRAAYAIIDTNNNQYSLNRVGYDIQKVQEQIRAESIHPKNANRLTKGK